MKWMKNPANGQVRPMSDEKAAILGALSRPVEARWTETTAPPDGYVPPISTVSTPEDVRDVIGAALRAGTNVQIVVNDAGDTITISATGGGSSYTDEQVRDVVAAALRGGTGVTVTNDDAGDTITIAATGLQVNTTGAAVGRVPAVTAVDGSGNATAFGLMRYFSVLAANPDLLIAGAITRDANGAATSAPVVWPDGTAGVYTGTPSTGTPGAIDSYAITYDPSGTANDRTFTQPSVTRDASGAVTVRPAITVA